MYPDFFLTLFDIFDIRITCPKFGDPALSSEFYDYALNVEFATDVGMLRRNKNIRNLKKFLF